MVKFVEAVSCAFDASAAGYAKCVPFGSHADSKAQLLFHHERRAANAPSREVTNSYYIVVLNWLSANTLKKGTSVVWSTATP
jgi:hypothetical protein